MATTSKKYGFFKKQTAEEHCRSCAKGYQSRFPRVSALSSETLLNDYTSLENVILVDCRTIPERSVSILQGAISLQDFEQNNVKSDKDVIITYCTIGYRSGMEAQRLQQKYNHLRIYSLDGIVMFTHALAKQETNSALALTLVDPTTNLPTQKVHCFGSMWACPHESYTAICYPLPILVLRTLQVGMKVTVRTFQTLSLMCCGERRHTHQH